METNSSHDRMNKTESKRLSNWSKNGTDDSKPSMLISTDDEAVMRMKKSGHERTNPTKNVSNNRSKGSLENIDTSFMAPLCDSEFSTDR